MSSSAPQRPWVILDAEPAVVDRDGEEEKITDGLVDLLDPPCLSHLVVPRRVCPDPVGRTIVPPYIIAVASSRILFHSMMGHDTVGSSLFLYDAQSRRVTRLPPVPTSFGLNIKPVPPALGLDDGMSGARGAGLPPPRRSIGLIEDPRHAGHHHIVAELHPTFSDHHNNLLCYSTQTDSWTVKPLGLSPQLPWPTPSHDGVVSHDGKLWWVDISRGILHCNPFMERPDLHFIDFPQESKLPLKDRPTAPISRLKIVRPSCGGLRFVAIHGSRLWDAPPVVSMWRLEDPLAPKWVLELRVSLREIWKAGLPLESVPMPVLVAPDNADVVYFSVKSELYPINLRENRILLSTEYLEHKLIGPRFLHAWEVPRSLLQFDPSAVEMKGALVKQQAWVILTAIPHVIPKGEIPVGTDVLLRFQTPPRPSYLVVGTNISPDFKQMNCFPYILATEPSGYLLLHATQGKGIDKTAFFLLNANTRLLTRLCNVFDQIDVGNAPFSPKTRIKLRARRSIGLIKDPYLSGNYMVAQLHPTSSTKYESLLYYNSASAQWGIKRLASSPEHKPWAGHGVFALHRKLWWVDPAYGLLTCDPFVDEPHLDFVSLPTCCNKKNINGNVEDRNSMDKNRMIRISEGKIRYVEIVDYPEVGPSILMCTLVDAATSQWALEYQAPFNQIWGDQSYKIAGLPPNMVPALAMVHPFDYGVVYFFANSKLFAVDIRERRVLTCNTCSIACYPQELFHSSRFLHAWELPKNLDASSKCGGDNWSEGFVLPETFKDPSQEKNLILGIFNPYAEKDVKKVAKKK